MTFQSIIENLLNLSRALVPVIVGLSVVVFLYGLFGYIMNSGDESKRADSVKYIVYGIIGLFVIVSVWGMVFLITDFFGLNFGIPQIVI
jgi:hypothetical protein